MAPEKFQYLSVNFAAIRAVGNEEFFDAETRRSWIAFSTFCMIENGCLNDTRTIAKAAMISQQEAEMFLNEITPLCEIRDNAIAPKEVWRAIDHARERRRIAEENGGKGGRPKKPTGKQEKPIGFPEEAIGFNREPIANLTLQNKKLSESESEVKRSEENTILHPNEVRDVFTYWQTVHNHPGAKLTDGRARKIKARLKEGYTVADLKAAIDGCKASPYHQGKNDTGTVYDDIELICRDGSKVENFKGYLATQPTIATTDNFMSRVLGIKPRPAGEWKGPILEP